MPLKATHPLKLKASLFLFSGLLISCGSGNASAPAPTPPMVENKAPTFTSSIDLSLNENGDLTYAVEASDPENDTVTITILDGGDSALFIFDSSASGGDQLNFIDPPNFERPQDEDQDNIYDLTFRLDDGQGNAVDQSITITVLDVAEPFSAKTISSGFTQPVYVTNLPGVGDRSVVLEKGGRARLVSSDGTIEPVDFLDVSATISTAGEGGLLGIAFAPDFETSGVFYVNVTNAVGDTEIRRYTTVSGNLEIGDLATGDVILTIAQPAGNHNAGWLDFDENGFLIVPTGDGGGAGDPNNLAQNTSELLGKILRLDVTGDDFPADGLRDYAIPSGNRFAGNPTAGREEIFAVGLRNPFRATFDPENGDLIFADVGQGAREEVNRLPINDTSRNFGWNIVEGTQDFSGTNNSSLTPPVTEYLHGSGPKQGNSITGGVVYTGPIDALFGQYVFGDFISGNLWAVPSTSLVDGQTLSSDEYKRLNDDFGLNDSAFGQMTSFGLRANDKALLITTINGNLYEVTPD